MKNPLDSLRPEQQEAIIDIAENEEFNISELAHRVAEPPPKGYGVWVSRGGLKAFIQRKQRERLLAESQKRLEEARRFADQSGKGQLEQGTLELLRARLFEQASGHLRTADLFALYRLAEGKEKQRQQQELARKKIEMAEKYFRLAQQRLELNAAKMALEHADEIKGLITQGEVPDGEKVQGALARLFGEKFAKAAKVETAQATKRIGESKEKAE